MILSLIAAVSENGVIGRAGQLPWHISADLRRFKRLTMNHCLLMGRKTFDSIGRPLPGRTSIVLTRDQGFHPPGVHVAHSLDQARDLATGASELFVIGGSQIYRLALPMADRIYLTRVHADVAGDAFFPVLEAGQWQLLSSEGPLDPGSTWPYSFQVLARTGHRGADSVCLQASPPPL